jgi:hypothetical protein
MMFPLSPGGTRAHDTLDKVSAESLRIVGEVVLEALPSIESRLAGAPPARQR